MLCYVLVLGIKMLILILLCIFFKQTEAAIYKLSDVDYARMPPLMHMDPYEECKLDADALYCNAEFALVSDKRSSLLDMIKEYSEHSTTHFNHTILRYGICVKKTCKKFYEKENGDLRMTLEGCLNQSLSEKYDLKVKILEEYYCMNPGRPQKDIDLLDVIVGVICLIILTANFVGSIFDVSGKKNEENAAARVLSCFSLKHNLKKLMASAADGQEPRLRLLKNLHGIRVLTMFLVIIGHSILITVIAVENPEFLEQVYSIGPLHILLNGTLIMQTFLWISAFLLVYNWLLHSEKRRMTWNMLPKQIFIRWLRLTPSYAVVLALTVTWFRHFASGPFWGKFVAKEVKDCRQYWWQHILYVNNYLDNTACMVQSWYLAVDIQLYIIAAILCVACKTTRSRKIVLSTLLVIGIITTVSHIYFQDLNGTLIISPESILSIFFNDGYFNYVYKRAHTNLTGYIIGMAMGFLVYHWQKQQVDFTKYQTFLYRLLYQSLFPLGAVCCYTGYVFYADGPRTSAVIRAAYAGISRPVFSISMGGLMVGAIFKIDDLYRSILEWRGWTVPSRLSYSAYLLHVAFIRGYVASVNQTTQHGYLFVLKFAFTVLISSFVAAFFFCLLVETPFTNIIKEFLVKPRKEIKKKIKEESSQKKKVENKLLNNVIVNLYHVLQRTVTLSAKKRE